MSEDTALKQREAFGRGLVHSYIFRYTYVIKWSDIDEHFVASVWELPSLRTDSGSPTDALGKLRLAVADVLDEMFQKGEKFPEPLKELPQPFDSNVKYSE